jgi:hypothetical protein
MMVMVIDEVVTITRWIYEARSIRGANLAGRVALGTAGLGY